MNGTPDGVVENALGMIKEIRGTLSEQIEKYKKLEAIAPAPAVQEIVLSRRNLEDTRMRLGVASAYLRGENPWRDRDQEIEAERQEAE